MEFNVKSGAVDKQKTACLIIGVQKTSQLPAVKSIDTLTKGLLSSIIKRGTYHFSQVKPCYSIIFLEPSVKDC